MRITGTAAVLTAFPVALAGATAAVAQQPRTYKFQSTWPASLTLQDNFRHFADRVDKLSMGPSS